MESIVPDSSLDDRVNGSGSRPRASRSRSIQFCRPYLYDHSCRHHILHPLRYTDCKPPHRSCRIFRRSFALFFQVAIHSLCVGYPCIGLVLCPLISLRCACVQGRLEVTLRILMTISVVLSIAGLIGVLPASTQIRNIRVLCYAVVAPISFLLMGIVFGRTQPAAANTEKGSTAANANH